MWFGVFTESDVERVVFRACAKTYELLSAKLGATFEQRLTTVERIFTERLERARRELQLCRRRVTN